MKVIDVSKLRLETYKNLHKVFLGADIKMPLRMGYAKNTEVVDSIDDGDEVKELEKPICIKNDSLINGGLCIEFNDDGVILWQQNHSLGCFQWKGIMDFCDYPSKTVFMMSLTVKVMDFLNR